MEFVHNEDCFVAFLDLLGFSDAVLTKSPKYIENIFETIKKCKNDIIRDRCAWPNEYDNLSNNTIVYIMSDSVVMAIKSDVNGALEFLIKWCKEIQVKLLFNHKMLVRGGISRGLHYQDNEIAFGTGFVRAHIIESSAKTPRIVIDDDIDIQCGVDVLEDVDKKKYIDFLGDYYWDDCEFDDWKLFADVNIKKNESLKEKYVWLSEQFKNCNDRYMLRKEQEEFEEDL